MLLIGSAAGAGEATINRTGEKEGDTSANASVAGLPQVHVYVSNKDDDRLEISLLVDGELKVAEEIGSGDEKKFGSYDLPAGQHRFVVAWRDEDTKKSYQEETLQEIKDGDSIILYTKRNDALEEFDISVQIKNEAGCDLEANLYVDGNFEKAKEVKKDGFTDMGSFKLEEGSHSLTLRWRDRDTGLEYERNKQISVEGDMAVAFYTPKGCSFEVPASKAKASVGDQSRSGKRSTDDGRKEASTEEVATTAARPSSPGIKNTTAEGNRTEKTTSIDSVHESGSEPGPALKKERPVLNNPIKTSSMMRMETRYLYAIVVVLAIALLFRH